MSPLVYSHSHSRSCTVTEFRNQSSSEDSSAPFSRLQISVVEDRKPTHSSVDYDVGGGNSTNEQTGKCKQIAL